MIYGDHFLVVLEAAKQELKEKEDFFVFELMRFESEVAKYEKIKNTVSQLCHLLKYDEIRGNTAFGIFDDAIVQDEKVCDIYYRLVESKQYEAVEELYRFIERKGAHV